MSIGKLIAVVLALWVSQSAAVAVMFMWRNDWGWPDEAWLSPAIGILVVVFEALIYYMVKHW